MHQKQITGLQFSWPLVSQENDTDGVTSCSCGFEYSNTLTLECDGDSR
jgi:hypothetical protein